VRELSKEAKEQYVSSVLETAKEMWGSETLNGIHRSIERTAEAVYEVSNYQLSPHIEPVTKMRLSEEKM
jgi:hypothetical protein